MKRRPASRDYDPHVYGRPSGAEVAALTAAIATVPLIQESRLTMIERRPALDVAIDLGTALHAAGWRLIHD